MGVSDFCHIKYLSSLKRNHGVFLTSVPPVLNRKCKKRVSDSESAALLVNCVFLWEKRQYLPPSLQQNTIQLTWTTIATNGGIHIFPQQVSLSFSTQGQACFGIVCPTQSNLAIVLSLSIPGHVCGGVLWRWLSRNTEALKLKRETFPCCTSEIDIVINSCVESLICTHLSLKVGQEQIKENCGIEVFQYLL